MPLSSDAIISSPAQSAVPKSVIAATSVMVIIFEKKFILVFELAIRPYSSDGRAEDCHPAAPPLPRHS